MRVSFLAALLPRRHMAIGFCLAGLGLTHPAAAQTTPAVSAGPAYVGPTFAGGPDSVVRVLQRAVRPASPALMGQVFLHLELDDRGRVQRSYLLMPPPEPAAKALVRNPEVKASAGQVSKSLANWQLTPLLVPQTAYQAQATLALVTLPLTFGPAAAAPALPYSEQVPVFPATLTAHQLSTTFPFNLIEYVQRQVRYPAQDLRNQVQGVVYAYFEISETGVVEQRRIVGSVSPTLDAEVLRALQEVPNALGPPRHQGRPARVSYVLPITFKIQ